MIPGRPELGRLSPAQEAAHIARRKEIYEVLHPETKDGGDRRSASRPDRQNGELKAERFTAATAAATGKSERTVQRTAQDPQGRPQGRLSPFGVTCATPARVRPLAGPPAQSGPAALNQTPDGGRDP